MPDYRLLYIEDNPVNTLIVEELLNRRPDIALRCCENGQSGLAEARAWQPQLVLLDMDLPDMDGREVLTQLRAHEATRAVPCIALSANAMRDDVEAALRHGFDAYWTKPIDFQAFYAGLEARFPSAT
jgi:CheY-like chemotaxis protein